MVDPYDRPMLDDPHARADAGRQRAAETKRARSQERLIAAATELFAERGWYGTRVEDVAALAGVSVATAYNHFPNKYHLLSAAYAPLLLPVNDAVAADLATTMPIDEVLHRGVHALCRMARQYRAMTVAVLSALPEIYARQGEPIEPNDPRFQVDMEGPVRDAVEAGRARGELPDGPGPTEVALAVTGVLCLRILTRPEESPQETADLLLRMLRGGLIG
jgi:AcrR family transcriptional regulator